MPRGGFLYLPQRGKGGPLAVDEVFFGKTDFSEKLLIRHSLRSCHLLHKARPAGVPQEKAWL